MFPCSASGICRFCSFAARGSAIAVRLAPPIGVVVGFSSCPAVHRLDLIAFLISFRALNCARRGGLLHVVPPFNALAAGPKDAA